MNTRVLLTLGGAVAATAIASAALVTPATADGVVSSDNLETTNTAALAVAAYWTDNHGKNLLAATPYGADLKPVSKLVSKGAPAADGKPGIVPAIGDEKSPAGSAKNVNLPKTIGKVFFTSRDGQKHWCSATSLQSQYRNLVATAGHCVYDTVTQDNVLDNWAFIPGYYQGKLPWGLYVGKQAFTHYDFDVYEDFDRDYAFVNVYNGVKVGDWAPVADETAYKASTAEFRRTSTADGKTVYEVRDVVNVGRLGDNVGGQGFAFNQKIGKYVFLFGYPAGQHPDGNRVFSGNTLKWSYGKTFKATDLSKKAEELQAVKSGFTGPEGASGSAWLLQYKNTRRLGYLNGVTSDVYDTNGNDRYDTSASAYFDGETYGVYKSAASRWSGNIAK
ncbi:hypothetical protein J5X84_10275 [Streptosporangiaceae bacterium NEAU-GS5]|nr:hypothetical protein [Streptosporangiaceae bacterium NEAU-GS5]